MKKTKNLKRVLSSLLLATSMMFSLGGASMDVKAAGSVSVTTTPESGITGGFEATFKFTGIESTVCIDSNKCKMTVTNVSGITPYDTIVKEIVFTNGAGEITVDLTYSPSEDRGEVSVILTDSSGTVLVTNPSITITGTKPIVFPDIPDYPDYPDTPDVPSKPNGNVFSVKAGTTIPEIAAGASMELEIPLAKNKSIGNSGKVQVSSSLPEGLYFYEIGNIQELKFSSSSKSDTNLKLKISANSDAKSGVYPIELTLNYSYSGGNVEEKLTTYIKVLGNGDASGRIQVTGYSFDKQNIKAGDTFNLTINLKNPSSSDVKNVRVGLGGLSSDGLLINNALDSNYIPVLAKNSSTTINFPLVAASNVSANNQILELSVSGDGMDTPVSSKIFAFVSKGTGSENGDSKPKIVIDSYNYGGESVIGGMPFNLNFAFRNTSSGVAIQNVKVTISSVSDEDTGGAFTPTSSSNSFFVKRLNANTVSVNNIELMPKADAKPKSYGLEIKFEYEANYKGELTEMSSTELISIPLTQSDRFEIGEVEFWGEMYIGNESQFNIPYVNKGKSTINNLEIKLESDDMTFTETGSYVGNVETGSSDSFTISAMANQAGLCEGKAIFTYEDANGKKVEVIKEFSANAIEMNFGPEEPVEPMPEEPTGLPLWGKVLIGVVLVGGIGAVAFVLYRKKKAKKVKLAEAESYDDFPEEGE